MVDFTTQTRHFGYKYNCPDIREAHDYRRSDRHQSRDWKAWLFSEGVRQTCDDVMALHHVSPRQGKEGKADKLLYTVGSRPGPGQDQFRFPRDLVTSSNTGNIFITDSGNHRIVRYNQCAVFVDSFGTKGRDLGQFHEPSGVCLLSNGYVAVADTGNNRLQVLTEQGQAKCQIATGTGPYHVRSDASDNLIVSTTTGHVEVYSPPGHRLHRFQVPGLHDKQPCRFTLGTDGDEIIVLSPHSQRVLFLSYDGEIRGSFDIVSHGEGLGCQPSAVTLKHPTEDETQGQGQGRILVADSLNHTINVYSRQGELTAQLVHPRDGAGSMQGLALCPEDQVVSLEYSVTGPHCLKIYRYSEAPCQSAKSDSEPQD